MQGRKQGSKLKQCWKLSTLGGEHRKATRQENKHSKSKKAHGRKRASKEGQKRKQVRM